MKTNYLLPNHFKKWAWFVFIPAVIFGICTLLTEFEPAFLDFRTPYKTSSQVFTNNNALNEILGVLIIVSGLIVAFSRTKNEDEFIQQMRLSSLVWAVIVNYFILTLAMIFVFDFNFLWVMSFNMFTVLVFFILHFHWKLWQFNKTTNHEE